MLAIRVGNSSALWLMGSGFTLSALPAVSLFKTVGIPCSFHELLTQDSFAVQPFPIPTYDTRCRVGGGALFRAGLRPPLKPSVQFSRTGLSPKCALTRPTSQVRVNFATGRWVDSVLQFPRTLPSGFFTKGTYPRQSLYSLVFLFAPTTLACRLPQLTALPLPRSHRFHGASGTIRQSDNSPSLTSHFAPRL